MVERPVYGITALRYAGSQIVEAMMGLFDGAADGKGTAADLAAMPFSEIPLGDIVKKRASEVGLMDAIAAQGVK